MIQVVGMNLRHCMSPFQANPFSPALLAVGCSAVGCWLLAVGCWRSAVCSPVSGPGHWHHRSPPYHRMRMPSRHRRLMRILQGQPLHGATHSPDHRHTFQPVHPPATPAHPAPAKDDPQRPPPGPCMPPPPTLTRQAYAHTPALAPLRPWRPGADRALRSWRPRRGPSLTFHLVIRPMQKGILRRFRRHLLWGLFHLLQMAGRVPARIRGAGTGWCGASCCSRACCC